MEKKFELTEDRNELKSPFRKMMEEGGSDLVVEMLTFASRTVVAMETLRSSTENSI